MITLILFAIFVISSLLTIFLAIFHGYIGAIVLGLNAILFDIFWQWLRI